MKVQWRKHELLLITIMAVIIISRYIAGALFIYAKAFTTISQNHIFTQVLFPQIGAIILLWFCYLWINRLIASVVNHQKTSLFKCFAILFQLVVISYLIGPIVNFASFYINPAHSGGPIDLPLIFGFHPQPVLNLFGGWNVSLFIISLYLIYAIAREIIISRYDKSDGTKAYAIQISNQVTLFLVFFFAAEAFVNVFDLVKDERYYHFYNGFMLPMVAVFLTNKYWLYPLKGNRSFLKWQVSGPVLFTTFVYSLLFSIFLKDDWSWSFVLLNWAIQLCFTTPVAWLDYQQNKNKINELWGLRTALVKSKADLQLLRMQINPHFLFNALNTLYGTALIESSPNTAEGIQKLGDMMRFMLHENAQDYISMSKEIDYLKNYISLQKLRTQLSPDIIITEEINTLDCNHRIAPMLLIPLVENAFKHGVHLAEKSWIKISLNCDPHTIKFEVRNSIHILDINDPEKDHSGIGLQNVVSRLQLLYPGKHSFNYGKQGEEFVANLTIDL